MNFTKPFLFLLASLCLMRIAVAQNDSILIKKIFDEEIGRAHV